jgi:hypothetical protein
MAGAGRAPARRSTGLTPAPPHARPGRIPMDGRRRRL